MLFRETGLLCFADEEDNPFLDGVIASFRMNPNAKHTVYDDQELREQFPQLKFGTPMHGCLDHSAGVLLADKALRAVQDLAVLYGTKILDGICVDSIQEQDGHVHVQAEGNSIRCKTAILCPGPWASPLLETVGLSLPLTTVKIPVLYWRLVQLLVWQCLWVTLT